MLTYGKRGIEDQMKNMKKKQLEKKLLYNTVIIILMNNCLSFTENNHYAVRNNRKE